jgi:hypothetical protein
MAIVRLLLILGIAMLGVALLLYLVTRDRRYLTFIVRVAKLLVLAAVVVIAYFVVEHLAR